MPQLLDTKKPVTISQVDYRLLFESLGAAVAIVRHDGVLRLVNRKFESLCGANRKDLEGRKTILDFFDDEDEQFVRSMMARYDGRRRKDGAARECLFYGMGENPVSVCLSIADFARTTEYLVTITEVAEDHHAHSSMADTEQAANLCELSASIAHEIRNPLGAINTSVELLCNSLQLRGEDRELMEIIREESQRLDRIIKDFLHFARLDQMRFSRTDVNHIIRQTLLLYKGSLPATVSVRTELDAKVPEIWCDADQIRQVVINMLVNCIEAMPGGGCLTLGSHWLRRNSSHENLQVSFHDTGQGIEKNNLHKIFKPFYSTKDKGVGMGLAICERIIHNHGGRIDVASQVGKGTTFIITLPIHAVTVEKE